MDAFLGIDTSCYTTSLCVVDSHFDVVADERIILTVPQGGRGLSQSNMVYQHMRNLPVLFERLAPQLESCVIRAVGVTDKPRRREDSYMPAFLAGLGYGRSLAAVLRVPLYTLSHQENHLLAALRATGSIGQEAFYGLHLSGGTTDLLKAVPDAMGLDIERVGGTSDISAESLVRIYRAVGKQAKSQRLMEKAIQYLKKETHREVGNLRKMERKGTKNLLPSETAMDYLYIIGMENTSLTASERIDRDYLMGLVTQRPAVFTIYGKARYATILALQGEKAKAKEYLRQGLSDMKIEGIVKTRILELLK